MTPEENTSINNFALIILGIIVFSFAYLFIERWMYARRAKANGSKRAR